VLHPGDEGALRARRPRRAPRRLEAAQHQRHRRGGLARARVRTASQKLRLDRQGLPRAARGALALRHLAGSPRGPTDARTLHGGVQRGRTWRRSRATVFRAVCSVTLELFGDRLPGARSTRRRDWSASRRCRLLTLVTARRRAGPLRRITRAPASPNGSAAHLRRQRACALVIDHHLDCRAPRAWLFRIPERDRARPASATRPLGTSRGHVLLRRQCSAARGAPPRRAQS
jgi:hypothetical protein